MVKKSPRKKRSSYNQKKYGYYGEFGGGANARIKFLQTAVSSGELDKFDLIQNIKGSEEWHVRGLFQRDVDHDRVERQILPYLQDEKLVKYFNPLTLILLPFDTAGEIEEELRVADGTQVEEDGETYDEYEATGFFRFLAHKDDLAFSELHWNDERVKVVAIDGQHRLSALKRWKKDPTRAAELESWHIPVVLLGIVKDNPDKDAPSILNVVRQTFVYINTKAEVLSDTRKIILDDESINAVCVQEIIEVSHRNDIKKLNERDNSIPPLLFFDWRGETKEGRRVTTPAALKSTEELLSWMEEYILGKDGDKDGKQRRRLQIDDILPRLETPLLDLSRLVSQKDTDKIRKQFNKVVYPGIAYLLHNFEPYKEYIKKLRDLENKLIDETDTYRHAFYELRFGFNLAGEDRAVQREITHRYTDLVNQLGAAKSRNIDPLMGRDIGMRGVVSAFDKLKTFKDERARKTLEWLTFSKWFVGAMNKVYAEGWFRGAETEDPTLRDLREHVVFDPSGSIVNYKFSEAADGFGTLLALLALKADDETTAEELTEAWFTFHSDLRKPVVNGYKKVIRAELRDIALIPSDRAARINRESAERYENRLNRLSSHLGVQGLDVQEA